MRGLFIALALFAGTATPALARDWNVGRYRDTFTDTETCRVERGGPFIRGLFGGHGRVLYFIVENQAGELRVGFRSQPLLPIPGEIQVRVDQNPLVSMTLADTPIDTGGAITPPPVSLSPEARSAYEQAMRAIHGAASPYRLLTGERARDLLRQILAGQETQWRVVGVNAALSGTGIIDKDGLAEAVRECDINLDQPAQSAATPSAVQ